MKSDVEDGDDENVYYFESDHLAVRGNRDYSNMVRAITILESQRMQVHQHIEELELAKQRYLDDPELLIEKLKNKEEIIAPNYVSIISLPEIGHYDNLLPEETAVESNTDNSAEQANVVRGRLFDESKPETFNQLWTCEEQQRLEQLLREYPVEPIEMRRFTKIAKALGNRTPQQVASRVQKYFKKLYDAGMPIPGRIPKNRRNAQSKLKNLFRPTTFFPAHNVTVHMPEEDDFQLTNMHDGNTSTSTNNSNNTNTIADDINIGNIKFHVKPEIRKRIITMLQAIRDEKRSLCDGYNPDPLASKCDNCRFAPVSSIHWRCNTCYCHINLCSDCIVSQLLSHKFDHLTHDVVMDEDK